jgi:hypothetical protein
MVLKNSKTQTWYIIMVLKKRFYLCFAMGKAIGWGGGHFQNNGGLMEFILPHCRPLILGVPHIRAEHCTKSIFVCVHSMREKQSNKTSMAGTIIGETKREGQKKA